uniref:MAPK kinase substrate protein n=1 Tax=Fagus sylvatica TaxID=28930 RepID=A0A2N9EKT7_FAGSY
MTTLQRSNVSFRRQGSSGLIWDDRLKVLEQKGGVMNNSNTSTTQKREQEHVQGKKRKQVAYSNPPNPSSSRPGKKAKGCSFSALFGRCIGSPTA